MIARPVVSEGFVGRRELIAFLDNELTVAQTGAARIVMLEGDVGSGKSRTVAEACDRVGDRATIAAARCEPGFERAYHPFLSLLQGLEGRARGRVSTLGRLRGRDAGDEATFCEAVVSALAREAARKPVVCVIEDVHWADPATLTLLGYVFRHLRDERVVVVVTYRYDDTSVERKLAGIRSDAARAGGSIIRLGGLARNEVRGLLQRSAAERSRRVAPEILAQIEDLAEGNPLFADELLGVALQYGTLRLDREIPLTARSIVVERLATFDEHHRDLLVRAAVVGRSFDAPFLAMILEQPLASFGLVLQRAVASGLLETDAPDHFRFRTELVRRVLADELIFTLAAPLHVRVATALESLGSASPAELAPHWAAAHVPDHARRCYEAAADAAHRSHAYRDAIRYYSEALRWNYPPGPARAALYEQLGTVLYLDGCRDEPLTRFARSRDEHTALRDALGSTRSLLLIADQQWVDARTDESLITAREAAAALTTLDCPELAAKAALAVARFEITLGRRDRAAVELVVAERHADAFTPELRANFSEIRAEVHAANGATYDALHDCTVAARLARHGGDGELIAQTENNVALVASDLGEVDFACRHHRRALDAALAGGIAWRVAYTALNYTQTLTLAGSLGQARALLETALETGVDTPTFTTKLASVGIPLALLLGDRTLAEACGDARALDAARDSTEIQRIGSVAAAYADLYAARGDLRGARALVRRALRELPYFHRCWGLAVAAGRYGDADDVARADVLLAGSLGRPRVRRAFRLLLEAFGQRPAAARAGRLAAAHFANLGWRTFEALALDLAGASPEARSLYAGMGAAPSHARPAPVAVNDPLGLLSQRQRQIADLVALGTTNREIAGTLHISEYTVEHHVSNIFGRLGVRSRAQLTAFVVGSRSELA